MNTGIKKSDDIKTSFFDKVSFKFIQIFKKYYYRFTSGTAKKKCILFILGCQRSGTSMMTRIMARDVRTKIFEEFSELSSDDPGGLRLNSFDKIDKIFADEPFSLLVSKPLVESQNSDKLLSHFNSAKAIWMFRHYKDVASSNLAKFSAKNCVNNLLPISLKEENNWRSERVGEETQKIIDKYFSKDMNPADAAVLFWLVRNNIFFEQKLFENENILMCKYEDLTSSPSQEMKRIYNFLGIDYPQTNITKEVSVDSKGKGQNLELNPEIEKLCTEVWEKLNRYYEKTHSLSDTVE